MLLKQKYELHRRKDLEKIDYLYGIEETPQKLETIERMDKLLQREILDEATKGLSDIEEQQNESE
jgi:hypothetical protein